MKTLNMARAAVTALAGVAFASASLPAHAEIKN
jgi:YtkA-like